jgi:SAM-dependent methyltransferase
LYRRPFDRGGDQEKAMNVDPIKYAKNRAYQFVEQQQQALDDGRITEAEWFDINNRFFTANHLAADNPRAQSGHGGGEARYRYTRMMVLEAIHKSGTFLDVGCANGYLMESLHKWLEGSGLTVEFYGLDFSEELIALAKRRLPSWRERFFIGNALYWTPKEKYDFVYLSGTEYVPLGRQKEFIDHLFDDCVAHGGRFILGPTTEERDSRGSEERLRAWGHNPTGYCAKSHPTHEGLAKKMFWFDKE